MENDIGYLSLLPDEILLKIYSGLSTSDLIQYCRAFPKYEYFLRERGTISDINLFKCYNIQNFNVTHFLGSTISYQYVTTLNINSVYWIKPLELRKCIKIMENLENLFILDTKLFLSEKNGHFLHNLTKLQKLAITIEGLSFNSKTINAIPHVKSLLLHIISKKSGIRNELSEISFRSELKELWIIDHSESCFFDVFFLLSHKNIKRFVFSTTAPLPVGNYELNNLRKIHENRRLGYIFLENATPLVKHDDLINAYDDSYKSFYAVWSHLRGTAPYGINDVKKLLTYDGTSTHNLYFEELNLCHEQYSCSKTSCGAVHKCLGSKFSKNVKKLGLQWCVFTVVESKEESVAHNVAKRRRVHGNGNYFRITQNQYKKLEELEIWPCAKFTADSLYSGLNDISSFKFLKKLSVCIPPGCNGNFLAKVFQDCLYLESLRLLTSVSNENLTLSLRSCLKHANALKDFRYENYYRIQIDNLFESLGEIESRKLERLFIQCKKVDKFSEKPLFDFLKKNPQLIFLFINVTELTDRAVKDVKRTLDTCREGRPEKVFLIKKDLGHTYYRMIIPSVHYEELIQNKSKVSTVDFHKHFMTPYNCS